MLTGVNAMAETAEPISLHPDNPRYFLWRNEPTILITSGEHYGALLNEAFDYRTYLKTLAADKLNHTRTFSGTYREIPESFGITDNTLAPKPGKYIAPWKQTDEPGYFDGGNKFDLDAWNPVYFARLKDFMREAQQNGIVVELTLFCPFYEEALWAANPMNSANNVNGIGDCKREDVYALKHEQLTRVQLAFTEKVVRELQEFDNLYFEICNEPYFVGVTLEWQHRIAERIVEVEKTLPRQHLISRNVANGREKVTDPHPAFSIFNFHYCVPPDVIALNADVRGVIGENETGFRGRADVIYRTEGWDFLLAGGGLYNNLDYSFTTSHPQGDLLDYQSPGGGSPALRRQLGILKQFLYGFDFVQMQPLSEVARAASDGFSVRVLGDPGKQYAVYVHGRLAPKPTPDDVQRIENERVSTELHFRFPPRQYRAEWIDTKTGEIVKSEQFTQTTEPLVLASPEFVADIAIRIQSSGN
jgi:hypothetical protein